MKAGRAQEIMQGNDYIPVVFNGKNVMLQEINEPKEEATVYECDNHEHIQIVPLKKLKEK